MYMADVSTAIPGKINGKRKTKNFFERHSIIPGEFPQRLIALDVCVNLLTRTGGNFSTISDLKNV